MQAGTRATDTKALQSSADAYVNPDVGACRYVGVNTHEIHHYRLSHEVHQTFPQGPRQNLKRFDSIALRHKF